MIISRPNVAFSHQITHFSQLSSYILLQCLQFRQQIFVVEQQSIYADIDGLDEQSWHVQLFAEDEHSRKLRVGYARIIPPHQAEEPEPALELNADNDTVKPVCHIGRIALAEAWRGQGLGKALVQYCLLQAKEKFTGADIALSAQLTAEPMYELFGFERCGEPYDDGGIMHVDMHCTATELRLS